MSIDIEQIAGLRALLDGLRTDVNAAYNPSNPPAISVIPGLSAALAAVTPNLARGGFAGLTLSNSSSNPTSHVVVAPGMARDSTNTADIVLTTGITKSILAVWAAGANQGGRAPSVAFAANQWFHVFLILNPTSGVVDVIFDQSATNPSLPTGFTKFRRIRGLLTDGSGYVWPFRQKPGSYIHKIPRGTEFAGQTGQGSSGTLKQLHVPRGIKVRALCYFQSTSTTNAANLSGIHDPDDGVVPAFGVPTQWAQIRRTVDTPYLTELTNAVWTDANGMVYMATNDSADTWGLGTVGYWDHAEDWGV